MVEQQDTAVQQDALSYAAAGRQRAGTLMDAEPTTLRTDVVIVGSGIAGLYAALKAAVTRDVLVITKGELSLSNTFYAQGGIAAAICNMDSKSLHMEDTRTAGAGLCDEGAVEVTVSEGVDCVLELVELGVPFDRENGQLSLTREGAHSRRRILHAHGDATGREIAQTLIDRVKSERRITVMEHCFAIDLIKDASGVCRGLYASSSDGSKRYDILAGSVVLASGGLGQIFRYTTNPSCATGDGVAMAFRAGAPVTDMEFHQFHPTALYMPGVNPSFLVSEAVRGEGARLLNGKGERFMLRYHELAELAPRDIVARSIVQELAATGEEYVRLDLTDWSREDLERRFPTIYGTCLKYGIDMSRDLVPVAPVAHYMMGGVATDLGARTTIPHLYACGEVACTGVHGANRLASNSLLEGLVFARRAVRSIESDRSSGLSGLNWERTTLLKDGDVFRLARQGLAHDASTAFAPSILDSPGIHALRTRLKTIMWKKVGIIRSGERLAQAIREIEAILEACSGVDRPSQDPVQLAELRNMATVSLLVATAALLRTESRGAHYRADFPEPDDRWLKRIVLVSE